MTSIAKRIPAFRLAAALAVTLVATLPAAANASTMKCASSTVRISDTPLLVVDGVVIGEIPEGCGANGDFSYTGGEGLIGLTLQEITYIVVDCVEVEIGSERESRGAISIGTRAGAEGTLRRYLTDLVLMQESYRQTHGSYAARLDEVGYARPAIPLTITLNTVDGGWSASTVLGPRSCRVAVGAAAAEGMKSAEIECSDQPQADRLDAPGPFRVRVARRSER